MQVYLCVRKTLDWSDLDGLEERVLPHFRAKYDTWNATFAIPYGTFRQRLKEITLRNLSSAEGAVVTPFEEIPPGGLIIPVDDDDWLAPHLPDVIRHVEGPDQVGYHWTRELLTPSRRRNLRRRWRHVRRRLRGKRDGHFCATNNYAVLNTPETGSLALSHMAATAWFEEHPSRVTEIPKMLAIQNRNLASQTTLDADRPTISRDELVEKAETFRNLYREWRLGLRLRWAQPCMDAMAQLMDDLRLR
ncbi:MAG: hypothetical protein ACYTG2_14950 [Planctomycetota bacterium]|jgi:hypothetical protein